jgi:hypothetical protein
MQAYRFETTLEQDGTLTLQELPFRAGERIEVIVFECPRAAKAGKLYSLRGTPIRYVDPTEPVAEEDWEAAP